MATLWLASAYCPDVPSGRESRGCILHGVKIPAKSEDCGGGTSFCGKDINQAEPHFTGGFMPYGSICKRCLRNQSFSDTVEAVRILRAHE